MAATLQTNIIVPTQFHKRVQQLTGIKSNLTRSRAVVDDADMTAFAQPANGGIVMHMKSMQDLDDNAALIPTDAAFDSSSGAFDASVTALVEQDEVAIKHHQNRVWGWNQLARNVSGQDLLATVENRVAAYVLRKEDDYFISTMEGVFADNTANDSADMTFDGSNGGSYVAGVSDISSEQIIDAAATLGDNADDIRLMMCHSVVRDRLKKLDLIDFQADSTRSDVFGRPMMRFGDWDVIVNDKMPNAAGVYDTWFFGEEAVLRGAAGDEIPVEIDRKPDAGNGGGETRLHYRWIRMFHPRGMSYTGAATPGGPALTVLDDAASWNRVASERKQVKIARLLTTES